MLRRAIALSLEGHKEEPCFETGLITKEISEKIKETKRAQKILGQTDDSIEERFTEEGHFYVFSGARKWKKQSC